jgi:hypothetical protein
MSFTYSIVLARDIKNFAESLERDDHIFLEEMGMWLPVERSAAVFHHHPCSGWDKLHTIDAFMTGLCPGELMGQVDTGYINELGICQCCFQKIYYKEK